eukprot:855488_1
MMRLKELESHLSGVEVFENPNVSLEQYPTSPHLAAQMLHMIEGRYGDITGKVVADLGCGSGMLLIGALMLDCSHAVGFEVDTAVLEIARENLSEFELLDEADLVQIDVQSLIKVTDTENASPQEESKSSESSIANSSRAIFDTVVMNPPFGTRVKGADVMFLRAAFQICTGAVYSLHKSSTRQHLLKKVSAWGVHAEVIAEMRFDIPKMYKFHRKTSKDIEVDLIRFDVSQFKFR